MRKDALPECALMPCSFERPRRKGGMRGCRARIGRRGRATTLRGRAGTARYAHDAFFPHESRDWPEHATQLPRRSTGRTGNEPGATGCDAAMRARPAQASRSAQRPNDATTIEGAHGLAKAQRQAGRRCRQSDRRGRNAADRGLSRGTPVKSHAGRRIRSRAATDREGRNHRRSRRSSSARSASPPTSAQARSTTITPRRWPDGSV